MVISPQIVLFVLFMLAVVQATRFDEKRQRRREARLHGHPASTRGHVPSLSAKQH